MRQWLLSLVVLVVLGASLAMADTIGRAAPPFALRDSTGKVVTLGDFQDKKAVVVLFLGTECPINNAFLPHLGKLSRKYASQGVQFVGINSNRQDTPARLAEHAQTYEIPFPVLKDEGNVVADQFGAQRVPEVFVLDAERKVRYHGRIDDQFGIGYKRPGKPTRHDLVEALDELLAGKPVSVPTTPVAGCFISRESKARADGTVTYSQHVARIVQQRCQECHRPGQVGPMALLTYDDAVNWSLMIREVLSDRRMPPWHADPRYGKFSNDRSLSDSERETLLAWIDQGCPKGDEKDLPPPRDFPVGWGIGTPDLILFMDREFEVPAEGPKNGIPYKYFTVETNFTEDRWVVRAEARPGAPEVVHHIIVFIVPPGHKFNPNLGNAQVLCGTAPGDMPMIVPAGMAKKIPAGSKLIFQMHYTPNGRAQKDRSSVGLIFAREKPERRVQTMPIATNPATLKIPAGAEAHPVESRFTFREDGRILSFMPHMHLRGKDFRYDAVYPDGTRETLLFVPRYDFNWQSVYRLAEPKAVPKGTRIECLAHFDNSAKNPNNPDPTRNVFWGDQTWEEMMIGWMDFVYERPAE